MSQYITTFDRAGKSTFTTSIPTDQNALMIPLGKITFLYTTHSMPAALTDDSDIARYAKDRASGLPPTSPCPPHGTSAAIIELAPGAQTPNRRTLTLGTFGLLEGQVELKLDSGEAKVLRAGDVAVLRCALHTWKNVTPGNGRAKLMVFAQSVGDFEVGGEKVHAVWD